MSIQGVQLIYRLQTTIRLFIDYRTGVSSFNVYYANLSVGPYALISSIENVASRQPATRGKIVFEFQTSTLVNWNDETKNYIKVAPVVGGVEQPLEGPLEIPTRIETIRPKEFSVIYGFNKDSQKFIPVLVDDAGKLL